MLKLKRFLPSLLMATSLAIPLMTSGCAAHVGVGYRLYDPYHHDYHVWDDHETVYYNQWAADNHRDPHRDFRKLNRNDQKEYWDWRHNHPDTH